MLDDYVRHAGPAFAIMALHRGARDGALEGAPPLELLLAGPLFALALYQRYAYRSVLGDARRRDRRPDAACATTARSRPTCRRRSATRPADSRGAGDARHRRLQGHQRPVRAPGRRRGAALGRRGARASSGGDRLLPRRRRGVRRAAARALDGAARRWCRSTGPRAAGAHRLPARRAGHDQRRHRRLPRDGRRRGELLRVADSALYWAKNHGKGRSCVVHAGHRARSAAPARSPRRPSATPACAPPRA